MPPRYSKTTPATRGARRNAEHAAEHAAELAAALTDVRPWSIDEYFEGCSPTPVPLADWQAEWIRTNLGAGVSTPPAPAKRRRR